MPGAPDVQVTSGDMGVKLLNAEVTDGPINMSIVAQTWRCNIPRLPPAVVNEAPHADLESTPGDDRLE